MRDSYVDISSYFYPEYKCLRIGRGVNLLPDPDQNCYYKSPEFTE